MSTEPESPSLSVIGDNPMAQLEFSRDYGVSRRYDLNRSWLSLPTVTLRQTMHTEEDGPIEDACLRFNGPRRLERAINTLSGIVQGIAADGVVKPGEVERLQGWVRAHREFADRHPFCEVIPLLDRILADGVVDDEELADLQWLTERISSENGRWDDITADMQELQGFLQGVLADGRINEAELTKLSEWVDARCHLRACWPYDELESVIAEVMRDGRIDDQEHEALLQFFGDFVQTSGRRAVGALDRESTVSGVCAYDPPIIFDTKLFCFTGKSDRGSRSQLASIVQELGGRFNNGLRNDTNYLVVGANGNPCWAYACYGRKIEDAVARRKQGQQLLVVHEFDFWDRVSDLG